MLGSAAPLFVASNNMSRATKHAGAGPTMVTMVKPPSSCRASIEQCVFNSMRPTSSSLGGPQILMGPTRVVSGPAASGPADDDDAMLQRMEDRMM